MSATAVAESAVSTGAGEVTIGQLLAPTGLTDALELTPAQLLNGLGLGQLGGGLPDLPALPNVPSLTDLQSAFAPAGLPELPALPALDPLALLAPLGELLRTFGTGTLPGGSGDPTAQLTGLASALQSGIGAATSAVQALSGLWSGQAATGAGIKSAKSAGDAGLLAAQGTAMTTDIQAGLAIVGTGLVALQGVIVKTATQIAATLPAIMTPPGQLAALGFAAEGVAEGLAVVAATRAQLAAPTAAMAANGAPIPVTAPPLNPEAISALVQAAVPLGTAALQFAGQLVTAAIPAGGGRPVGALTPTSPGSLAAKPGAAGTVPAGSGAGAAGTGGVGAGGGLGAPTVRPAGVGGGSGVGGLGGGVGLAAPEPTLGSRPISAEPVSGASPSNTGTAPGWGRPVAGGGMGMPIAPLAPMGGSSGPRTSTVGRDTPFGAGLSTANDGATGLVATDAGASGLSGPVLGEMVPVAVSVDVDFRLSDA